MHTNNQGVSAGATCNPTPIGKLKLFVKSQTGETTEFIVKKTMKMVHSIETTPLKHILKQINQKFGISQEEIEELSSDNSMGSLAERQFALI